MSQILERFAALRDASDISTAELDTLWADLRPVSVEDVLGRWHGGDFATGHVVSTVLRKVGWHGKWLDAPLDVTPIVCRDNDGTLYAHAKAAGGGGASLWPVEFRGEMTATMVYDALPVLDHFKQVDEHTLMGIMNGKLDSVFGIAEPYHFWLERDR